MRKLRAIIAGILLALLVALTYQYFGQRDGQPLPIAEYFKNLINRSTDTTPSTDISLTADRPPAPEPEENLSYDQRIEKGNYYFDKGFLSLAVNEYVKGAKLAPNRLEPYQKLLDANMELAEYEKARFNAASILQLDPNDFDAQYTVAQIDLKQSKFEEAQLKLNNLALKFPEEERIPYYQGLLKMVFNDHDTAQELLRRVQSVTLDTDLQNNIEVILKGYDEFKFAQAAEELYLSELLARSLNQMGEFEMAIYKLKDILKTRADLRDSWTLLGFAYLNLQKNYFALTSFEKAYEIDPEWPVTQYFLGVTHSELEQNDDAIIYLNYALSNGFEPRIVLKQKLADLYLAQGSYEEAVKAYNDILEYTKDDVSAYVRPIWIYIDFLNRPREALKLAEVAAAAFPESAMAMNLLGWSQMGVGKVSEAEENLTKAIELNPTFAAPYFNLGNLQESLGRNAKAIEAFQKAFELDQNGTIGNLAAQKYNELLAQ